MNRLTSAISVAVLAISTFFLLSPPAAQAYYTYAQCMVMGSCTVRIIASGQQSGPQPCVPTGSLSQYCACGYTNSPGWGYTFQLLTDTCPYGPAAQF